MAGRFGTVFILVMVATAELARAQSMMWPQNAYPPQPQYVAPRQVMPSPMFAGPAQQPYRVANYSPAQVNGANQQMLVPQQSAPSQSWNGGNSMYAPGYAAEGYAGDCYGMAPCETPCQNNCYYSCPPTSQWFGYAGALMLNREDENHRFFSYDSNDESYQLLDSQDSNFSWAGGIEAHVGHFDCCTCRGCEVVYWGIYPETGYAYAYPSQVTGNLNGIFNFDQLDYNGQTANNYVDNAAVHRLRRDTNIHNVEFNYIWVPSGMCGTSCCSSCCTSCCDSYGQCCGGNTCGSGACTFRGLLGLRYLRVEDNLQFASDPNDTMFTGEVDELYYTIDTDNDLFGFQLGGIGEKPLYNSCVFLTFGAKAGVFFNDADAHSTIGGAAGLATINNGPNNGVPWNVVSHKDDVATIAELQAGVAWAFTPTWRVRGEYRVIGISGLALPTNQIYQDLRGVQDVALLSTNGDLILHGVFVGVERTY